MRGSVVLSVLGWLLSVSAVSAADQAGRFGIKGVGISTCADYTASLDGQTDNRYLFAGWLNGYITAYNQLSRETFDVASWQTVTTLADYLHSFCSSRPDMSFFEAVGAMAHALAETKLDVYSDPQRIERNGGQVVLYSETVRRIQTRLKTLGLYDGAVDGAYSEATATALAAFQRAKGHAETGLPDQQTLHDLMM